MDEERKARKREYDLKWHIQNRAKNLEARRERDRIYQQARRADPVIGERIRARDRAKKAKIRDHINAVKKTWYHANLNGMRDKAIATYRKNYDGGDIKFRIRSAFHAAKSRAKQRGIPFDLTQADLGTPMHCAVTGIEFDMTRSFRQGNIFVPSLDRIDPTLGYVKGNVRVVCHGYNLAKHTGTDSDVLKLARALVKAFPE